MSASAVEPTRRSAGTAPRPTWQLPLVLAVLAVLGLGAVPCAAAQTMPSAQKVLPAIQVNASRLDIPAFDVPASLSVVTVDPAASGQPGVNLSEVLAGVPGILARERQDYAQDTQLSIRGFGARTTFGVRGIRIYMDGIPATLPDGQGQVSQFNLESADRIEVLRGPYSALYGNAAGGVVQLWTAPGTATPQTTLGVSAGSDDSFKFSADTRGTAGGVRYNIAASQFLSGGYRSHSRVRRQSANARFDLDLGPSRSLTLVLNRFFQPVAQDPQGLTAAQVRENPRQPSSVADAYNVRKATGQTQLGAIVHQQLGEHDALRLMAYYGQRSIEQVLPIPPAVQRNPLQAGGVVAPWTNYGGADARWTYESTLAGRALQLVAGVSGDYQRQRRLGYENFIGPTLGVRGALRRDENDNVSNVAEYLQGYWRFAPRWSLLLGVRQDTVRFAEHDFYITAHNPDDSGSAVYRATTPVAALEFRPASALRLYASYGEGFETPSYAELGYRSDGQPGLTFNLRPARSRHVEAGAKWRPTPTLELDAAAFRATTDEELAVATNHNGRATYRNVGHTRRQGLELSLTGELAPRWQLRAGVTRLDAQFRSGFLTCTDSPCATADTPVASGTRMPGVPDRYGSMRLIHGGSLGWTQALTLSAAGAVSANDTGTASAPGYALMDFDTGYTFALDTATRLSFSARIDNLLDRHTIGAVIVNDGNARYYQPAPGRSYIIGARLSF